MLLNSLTNTFKTHFHHAPTSGFFAPGRVNLIGEHIDYNGGLVFPCAITKGTYAVVSKRDDQEFHLFSENFKDLGTFTILLNDLTIKKEDNWTNYVKGVLSVLLQKGYVIPFGLNIAVYGDLPNGAGLSSSASLEMLMCKIFTTCYDFDLAATEMALIGKQVENEYIGVNSGIMDQFAVALGQKDSALLLDCATRHYEYIPFHMANYELVIMNTNKRRELADSKYNERFGECTTALKALQKHFNIQNLCDLHEDALDEIGSLLDPTLYKRVKHVITENDRVHEAAKCLSSGNITDFGRLLNASHASLQKDYEVTGIELDTLAMAAQNAGAIGARMTGAGFGGCAIALVDCHQADALIAEVDQKYKEVIGYSASFYKAAVGNGPIQIQ